LGFCIQAEDGIRDRNVTGVQACALPIFKLRKDAVELRELVAANKSDADIQKAKEKMLNEIYRMLAYTFGEPPASFDFEYRDTDRSEERRVGKKCSARVRPYHEEECAEWP